MFPITVRTFSRQKDRL